ncbi:hypothetical protein WJX74_010378 [Apatococcus lobatus]|uniref:3-oxoacyl-[acyl-carrier-protein] synthase n=1 Tax=Apatococcus lobatus TaxID=904363 RepID=A0AAW1QIX2_9CHLO
MGVCSCFGNDVDTFYNSLLAGQSGVVPITKFDASDFPTNFAAQIEKFDHENLVDRKNARRYDDAITYAVVSAKKALQQAGLDNSANADAVEKLDKRRAGVLIGSGIGGSTVFHQGVKKYFEAGHRKITPFFIPYTLTNMGSALAAIDLGFMGPNYSISTACATANYAFVNAANHIRNGDADLIVAGGSEAALTPIVLGGFVACRALSKRRDSPAEASRPWDKDRDGFVMGEGAGVLVMESLQHAQERGADILAEYLGGALTCDAHHMTDPREDGLGVFTCIERAISNANIDKDAVNYINAHATSTKVGDVAEIRALTKVFSDPSRIKMNATKSMIGHSLGASGGMEAIATIKAIQTGKLHPTLNQVDLVDEMGSIDTCPEQRSLEITAGLSNSFGFGGHNSVVIFGPYKQ